MNAMMKILMNKDLTIDLTNDMKVLSKYANTLSSKELDILVENLSMLEAYTSDLKDKLYKTIYLRKKESTDKLLLSEYINKEMECKDSYKEDPVLRSAVNFINKHENIPYFKNEVIFEDIKSKKTTVAEQLVSIAKLYKTLLENRQWSSSDIDYMTRIIDLYENSNCNTQSKRDTSVRKKDAFFSNQHSDASHKNLLTHWPNNLSTKSNAEESNCSSCEGQSKGKFILEEISKNPKVSNYVELSPEEFFNMLVSYHAKS